MFPKRSDFSGPIVDALHGHALNAPSVLRRLSRVTLLHQLGLALFPLRSFSQVHWGCGRTPLVHSTDLRCYYQ